jgi:hypothetical protein
VRGLSIAFAALCFALLLGSNAEAGPPKMRETTEFGPDSKYALIVFETEPQTIVPSWYFGMSAFDPVSRKWAYKLTKGWSQFEQIEREPEARRFHAALVEPGGVYAVSAIRTQGYWEACLSGGTKAFKLETGRVNFVGVIDPKPTLMQIAEELPHVTHGQRVLSLFDSVQLSYTPASMRPNWEADLSSFLASNFPKVTAPLIAPEPIDTTFEPSTSPILGKTCQKY